MDNLEIPAEVLAMLFSGSYQNPKTKGLVLSLKSTEELCKLVTKLMEGKKSEKSKTSIDLVLKAKIIDALQVNPNLNKKELAKAVGIAESTIYSNKALYWFIDEQMGNCQASMQNNPNFDNDYH